MAGVSYLKHAEVVSQMAELMVEYFQVLTALEKIQSLAADPERQAVNIPMLEKIATDALAKSKKY